MRCNFDVEIVYSVIVFIHCKIIVWMLSSTDSSRILFMHKMFIVYRYY